MALMTLTQMQSLVRYLTKEPFPNAPQFATNARVLQFLNLAQLEIGSRTKCYTSSNVPNSTGQPTDNTVAGQRLYAMPSDCQELLAVKVSVWNLKRVTLGWLNDNMGYQWWTFSGVPQYYYIEKKTTNSFGIFYTPQSIYPLALWYTRKPTALVNASDTLDLDERLQMAAIYWTCERVMEGRREMNFKSGYWDKKFEAELVKWDTTADQSVENVDFLGETPLTSD